MIEMVEGPHGYKHLSTRGAIIIFRLTEDFPVIGVHPILAVLFLWQLSIRLSKSE